MYYYWYILSLLSLYIIIVVIFQLQTGENSSIPNTFCVLSKQKVIELLDHE